MDKELMNIDISDTFVVTSFKVRNIELIGKYLIMNRRLIDVCKNFEYFYELVGVYLYDKEVVESLKYFINGNMNLPIDINILENAIRSISDPEELERFISNLCKEDLDNLSLYPNIVEYLSKMELSLSTSSYLRYTSKMFLDELMLVKNRMN